MGVIFTAFQKIIFVIFSKNINIKAYFVILIFLLLLKLRFILLYINFDFYSLFLKTSYL